VTWQRIPLKDVGTWYGGATPSKSNASFWTDGTIPWLSPKDMGPEVLTSTQDRITRAAVEQSSVKLVPGGSTAVVVRSGIIERTLPVSLVPFDTALNQDMKAVQPRADIDARWIAWGLRAFERELLRETRKAGTTVASIEWPRFQAFEIPVPPLEDQRRIIDRLEDHLSRLDAAGAYLEAAQRRRDVLHDQLLASALATVESAELPLAELLADDLANGKSVPTQEDGFPVLRLTALRDGHIDLAERKPGAWTAADARRFLVKRGDFLIARGNGSLRLVGRGGLITDEPDAVAFPDTLIRARPDLTRIHPQFMAYVWNAPGVRRQIETAARTTAGIYKVNQKDLAAVRVPVPSLADQERVTAAVRESRDALSRLALEIGHAVARSSALRRSVLAAAFSGRLTGDASDQSEAEEMISA
jgi:type I restriction enzyme S subunit